MLVSSASVMERQASSPDSASGAPVIGKASSRSARVSFATVQPRFGVSSTRPSVASTFMASRSGVRDTPNWLQRSFSDSFSPGASSPSTIIWRRRSASSLCSGRRWIGAATSMLMGVQAFLVHCAVGGLAEQPCDMHRLATRALADLVAAGGAVGNDDRLGTGRAHPRQQAELAHAPRYLRSEEQTSELQSLMRISYAVFCLKHTTTTPAKRQLRI